MTLEEAQAKIIEQEKKIEELNGTITKNIETEKTLNEEITNHKKTSEELRNHNNYLFRQITVKEEPKKEESKTTETTISDVINSFL